MPRIPYERAFLRGWIHRIAEEPLARPLDEPLQTTYERTFRWHLGEGDRPSLFLFRRATTLPSRPAQALTAFDAVLLDGDHDYEWVRHELAERGACVRPGGVILVHRRRGCFERALLSLHAWAADGGISVRWPRTASLEVAQVFEDLRAAAAQDETPLERAIRDAELRDLREDFELEASADATSISEATAALGLAQRVS